jgi:hypothetical protein
MEKYWIYEQGLTPPAKYAFSEGGQGFSDLGLSTNYIANHKPFI